MASPPLGSSKVENSSSGFPSSRIRELLALCSTSVEAGDVTELEGFVVDLVNSLNSLYEDAVSDPDNTDLENIVFQVLAEILAFLSSSVDQAVTDALSFELPKTVSKFAYTSSRCLKIVDDIVDRFVTTCSPRDMLSILCEALVAVRDSIRPSYCSAPLLCGLSKVFLSIKRRHYEHLKVAVPVVAKVLKEISLETEVEIEDLYNKALGVAFSIRGVCSELKSEDNAKLRSLLGLYVLQIMALLSVSIRDKVEACLPLITELAPFLTYCGFTYLGLITGHVTDKEMRSISGDDEDDFINSFPDINLGASLSVIWAKVSNDVTQAARSDISNVVNELQSNQVKRWQAYGMLKYVISSGNLLWEFRRHTIEFLLDITKEVTPSHDNDEQIVCSQYTPSIYAVLQAVTLVIMHAPNADLRKKTFEVLKRVLSDIPTSQRFDVLRALVTNSKSPSMTAILLDLVRDNISKRSSLAEDFVCAGTHVLELVELILRPPNGGPPLLPEQSDAVLAALNLYRFALLIDTKKSETCGKNKSSEVLSKKNLRKAYEEWLLPLRTLVRGAIAENHKHHDHSEAALDIACTLNPIELVLYRCIELVEDKLKTST